MALLKYRLLSNALLGAALGLLALGSALADTATPGRIAVALDAEGNGRSSRIFVGEPTGANLRPATPGVGRDRDPAFSPTGQTLAYQTNSQGVEQIVLAPVEGGASRVLVDGGSKPQWSRDGQRIIFSRRLDSKDRLFVIRADGKQKDQDLKPLTDGRIGRWSPDERQIALATTAIVDKADHWQLRVVPAEAPDTGPRKNITLPEDWGPVLSLEWAPSGQSLLFSISRGGQNELYVLDLSAPEPRRVPAGEKIGSVDYGVWSPDGKEILFRSSSDPGASASTPTAGRLCLMKADGTGVHSVWEPEIKTARIQGLTWYRPSPQVAANPPMPVKPPVVEPVKPPVVTPMPMPLPMPAPAGPKVLGPPVKLQANKVFQVARERSPVTVNMATPGATDFVVNVPVEGSPRYKKQRQGVGITLELEDGSLYRGNVIYSGATWITLQGRAKGGKVRLIDGKQLDPEVGGFKKGFELTLRRDGANLVLALNGQDQLSRPVLTSAVRQLSLTLENFDVATANVPVGNVYYRQWVQQPSASK